MDKRYVSPRRCFTRILLYYRGQRALASVADNGISWGGGSGGEEVVRRVSCFSSYLRGERSPYRSAAHNATVRAISFLIPFYSSTRKVVRVCKWSDTEPNTHPVKVHARIGEGGGRGRTALYTTRRMCTAAHADAKATRESDGVLFTRRVAETRRPIESRPARATD